MKSEGNTKKTRNKKRWGKWKILLLVLAVLIIGAATAVLSLLSYIAKTTPEIDPSNIYSLLAKTSVIYDDKGETLQNIDSTEHRTNVPIEQMPENLVNAVISIEDKTFYEHHGFNYVRLMGAVMDSITKKERIGGTSTITQQLARSLYLTNERTMIRKLREAYYTVQLERELSKDQIIEAYLNTIYLGFNSYGVERASQSYFSKSVSDLTLEECATLAAIPKNPSGYAPLKRFDSAEISSDDPNIVSRSSAYTILYNDRFMERQKQILDLMLEQEMISPVEYQLAKEKDMKAAMKPAEVVSVDIYSYFMDYLIKQVKGDLMESLDLDEEAAEKMLENGGLKIYSTMNSEMQRIAAEEFLKNTNFPRVTGLAKDRSGNILDSEKRIILFSKSSYFDDQGNFLLSSDEYRMDEEGNLVLLAGKKLNFYKAESAIGLDYQVEFNKMYFVEDGVFYVINGGVVSIPAKYKERNEVGDLIVDKSLFIDDPEFLRFTDKGIVIGTDKYSLRQNVVQPQGAMVISNWDTGEIKAMVGGRNLVGKKLYNRAINPRQPGSAIKPIGVYGPALEIDSSQKTQWTAGSYIEDSEFFVEGKVWPKNWYTGYRGYVTLRNSVEQSINVNAVKLLESVGVGKSIDFIERLGVSSLQPDDRNLAALGLGGMTRGISPLEMTAAYGAFPNAGVYVAPSAYTKVLDANGQVLLEKETHEYQAMDKGVAFIMTDILRTTVSRGIARAAAIEGQPVAGKTGTTTDNYDSWFVGFTPQFASALWIGNDYNVELSEGSSAAAKLWSTIMEQVSVGLPEGSYPMPDNVEKKYGEYYLLGTYDIRKQPTIPAPEVTEGAIDAEVTGGAVTSGGGIENPPVPIEPPEPPVTPEQPPEWLVPEE